MEQEKGKKALLVVSFGTSHAATRPRTIEADLNDLVALAEACSYRSVQARRSE